MAGPSRKDSLAAQLQEAGDAFGGELGRPRGRRRRARGGADAGDGGLGGEDTGSAGEGVGAGRLRRRQRPSEGLEDGSERGAETGTGGGDSGGEARGLHRNGKGFKGGRKGRKGEVVEGGVLRDRAGDYHDTTSRRLLTTEPEAVPERPVHTHIPKQAMFSYLVGVAADYNKIWLLDEDISLVGFNIPQFLYFSNCHDRSQADTPDTQLLVTQPIVAQNTQDRISVSASYWKQLQNESLAKHVEGSTNRVLSGTYTGFVESQAPLFESNYFIWYTNYIIAPLRKQHLTLQSGWGAGHTVSRVYLLLLLVVLIYSGLLCSRMICLCFALV